MFKRGDLLVSRKTGKVYGVVKRVRSTGQVVWVGKIGADVQSDPEMFLRNDVVGIRHPEKRGKTWECPYCQGDEDFGCPCDNPSLWEDFGG